MQNEERGRQQSGDKIQLSEQTFSITTEKQDFLDEDDEFLLITRSPFQKISESEGATLTTSDRKQNQQTTSVNENRQIVQSLYLPRTTITPGSHDGSKRVKEITTDNKNYLPTLEKSDRSQTSENSFSQVGRGTSAKNGPSIEDSSSISEGNQLIRDSNSGNSYLPTRDTPETNQNLNLQLVNSRTEQNRGPVNRNRGRRVNPVNQNPLTNDNQDLLEFDNTSGLKVTDISPEISSSTVKTTTNNDLKTVLQSSQSRSRGHARVESRQTISNKRLNQVIPGNVSSNKNDDFVETTSQGSNFRRESRLLKPAKFQPISQKSLQNLITGTEVSADAFQQFPQLNHLGGNIQQIGFRIIKHNSKIPESQIPTPNSSVQQHSVRLNSRKQQSNVVTGQSDVKQSKKNDRVATNNFPINSGSTAAHVSSETFTKSFGDFDETTQLQNLSRRKINKLSNTNQSPQVLVHEASKSETLSGSFRIPGFSKGVIRRNGKIIEGTARPRNHNDVTTPLPISSPKIDHEVIPEEVTHDIVTEPAPFRRVVSRKPGRRQRLNQNGIVPQRTSPVNKAIENPTTHAVPRSRSSRGRNRHRSTPQRGSALSQEGQNQNFGQENLKNQDLSHSKGKHVKSLGHEIKTTRDFEKFIEEDIDAATASLLAGIQPPNVIRNKKDLTLPLEISEIDDQFARTRGPVSILSSNAFSENVNAGSEFSAVEEESASGNREITVQNQPRLSSRQRSRSRQTKNIDIPLVAENIVQNTGRVNVRRRVINRGTQPLQSSDNSKPKNAEKGYSGRETVDDTFSSNYKLKEKENILIEPDHSLGSKTNHRAKVRTQNLAGIEKEQNSLNNRRNSPSLLNLVTDEDSTRSSDDSEINEHLANQKLSIDNLAENNERNKKLDAKQSSFSVSLNTEDEDGAHPQLNVKHPIGATQNNLNILTSTVPSNKAEERIEKANIGSRVVNVNSQPSRLPTNAGNLRKISSSSSSETENNFRISNFQHTESRNNLRDYDRSTAFEIDRNVKKFPKSKSHQSAVQSLNNRANRRTNRNLTNLGTVGSVNTENINGKVHPELTTTTTTTTTTRRPRITRTPRPPPPPTTPRPVNRNRGQIKFEPSQFVDWSWLSPNLREQLNSLHHRGSSRTTSRKVSQHKSLQTTTERQVIPTETHNIQEKKRKTSTNLKTTATEKGAKKETINTISTAAVTANTQRTGRRRIRNNHVKVRVSPVQQIVPLLNKEVETSTQSVHHTENGRASPVYDKLPFDDDTETTTQLLSVKPLRDTHVSNPEKSISIENSEKLVGTQIISSIIENMQSKTPENRETRSETPSVIVENERSNFSIIKPAVQKSSPTLHTTARALSTVESTTESKVSSSAKPTDETESSKLTQDKKPNSIQTNQRRRKRIKVNRRPVENSKFTDSEVSPISERTSSGDGVSSVTSTLTSKSVREIETETLKSNDKSNDELRNISNNTPLEQIDEKKQVLTSLKSSSRDRNTRNRRLHISDAVDSQTVIDDEDMSKTDHVVTPSRSTSRRRGRKTIPNEATNHSRTQSSTVAESSTVQSVPRSKNEYLKNDGESRLINAAKLEPITEQYDETHRNSLRVASRSRNTRNRQFKVSDLETENKIINNEETTTAKLTPETEISFATPRSSVLRRGRITIAAPNAVDKISSGHDDSPMIDSVTSESGVKNSAGSSESANEPQASDILLVKTNGQNNENEEHSLRTSSLGRNVRNRLLKNSNSESIENLIVSKKLNSAVHTQTNESSVIARSSQVLRTRGGISQRQSRVLVDSRREEELQHKLDPDIKDPVEDNQTYQSLNPVRRRQGSRRRVRLLNRTNDVINTHVQDEGNSEKRTSTEIPKSDETKTAKIKENVSKDVTKLVETNAETKNIDVSEDKPERIESQVRLRTQRRRQFSAVKRKVSKVSITQSPEEEKIVEKKPKRIVVSVLNNSRGSRRRLSRRQQNTSNKSVQSQIVEAEEKPTTAVTPSTTIDESLITESPINTFIRTRSRTRNTPSPITTEQLTDESPLKTEIARGTTAKPFSIDEPMITTIKANSVIEKNTLDEYEKNNIFEANEIQKISESQNRRRTAVRRRLINRVDAADEKEHQGSVSEQKNSKSVVGDVIEQTILSTKIDSTTEKSTTPNFDSLFSTSTESTPEVNEQALKKEDSTVASELDKNCTDEKVESRSRTDFPIRRRGSRKLVKKVKLLKNKDQEKLLENVFETLRSGNKNKTISSSELAIPGVKPGSKLRVVGTSVKKSVSTSSSSDSEVDRQNISLLDSTLQKASPGRPSRFFSVGQELEGSEGAETAVVRTRVIKRKLSS